jgi:hypothetical protein
LQGKPFGQKIQNILFIGYSLAQEVSTMPRTNERHEQEIEAGCRLALAGGQAAGLGDGYKHVAYWMAMGGITIPPCRDGVAKDGKLDRLGRPLQRGRGMGLFDDCWPVVHPALAGHPYPAIIEMVPVNFKGSKSDPYGNRDLVSGKWDADADCVEADTPLASFLQAVEAGVPVWCCLLTEQDGKLMMRRADASAVWRAGLTTSKGKPVCWLRPFGSGAYKGRYRRARIEWRHVPTHLWLDADWVEFDATSPIPIPYL